MRILITNDDGIGSLGIEALAIALSPLHSVTAIAPDSDRSGVSHSITHAQPIRVREKAPRKGEAAAYAISGTPVDCVRLALLGDLMERPDLVVAGINHGDNLGSDLLYSGTAAAARQAALMGLPAIALSYCFGKESFSAEGMLGFASMVAERLEWLVTLVRPGSFLNMNHPNGKARGLKAAAPVDVKYSAGFKRFDSSHYGAFYFPESSRQARPPENGSDWDLSSKGWITLSSIPVIAFDPAAQRGLASLLEAESP